MKVAKIIISNILILTILFLSASSSFATTDKENNYNFLLDQGYPASYLDNLTENTLQKMVDIIGNGYVGDVSIERCSTFDNSSNARGLINESNLDLNIAPAYIYQSGTTKLTGILVSVSWLWAANKPLYRGEDAITINWDNTIFAYSPDTFYAQDVYKSNINDEWSVFKEYDTLAVSNQGGIGHWSDLKALKKYVGGEMLFLLTPTSPMVKGSTYFTSLNVEYAHEPIALTGLSISIVDFGVGISWNLSCDTMSDSCLIEFSR